MQHQRVRPPGDDDYLDLKTDEVQQAANGGRSLNPPPPPPEILRRQRCGRSSTNCCQRRSGGRLVPAHGDHYGRQQRAGLARNVSDSLSTPTELMDVMLAAIFSRWTSFISCRLTSRTWWSSSSSSWRPLIINHSQFINRKKRNFFHSIKCYC